MDETAASALVSAMCSILKPLWDKAFSHIKDDIALYSYEGEVRDKLTTIYCNRDNKAALSSWLDTEQDRLRTAMLNKNDIYAFFSRLGEDITNKFLDMGLQKEDAQIAKRIFIEETLNYLKENNNQLFVDYRLSEIKESVIFGFENQKEDLLQIEKGIHKLAKDEEEENPKEFNRFYKNVPSFLQSVSVFNRECYARRAAYACEIGDFLLRRHAFH